MPKKLSEKVKELLNDADDMFQEHKETVSPVKEELIQLALDKIYHYFEETVQNLPVTFLNVEIGSMGTILLRHEDRHSSVGGEKTFAIFQDHNYFGNYYALTKNALNNDAKFQNSYYVSSLKTNEKSLFNIVKNFDTITKNIDDAIIKAGNNLVNNTLNKMVHDEKMVELLDSFVR